MNPMWSEYALSGAMLVAVAVVLAGVAYINLRDAKLVRLARWGMGLLALLLSLSSWGLLRALLSDNFKLEYVAHHSERALGTAYKVAAFWAGQEGSLLFWAWVLGVMGAVMALRLRKRNDGAAIGAMAVMAAVAGFFVVIMLMTADGDGVAVANPFRLAEHIAEDGKGLNPILQNVAMIAHPPLLFLGYAGFTVPFALLIGSLLSGRKDTLWLPEGRLWMVFSWAALTVGIVLGSWWAYVELGWGGYWAWDPVENASLLPWLTGTALLHVATLQSKQGIFKRWTAVLTAVSFLLCIFGTYVTRSGVIQSVHSFGESPIGNFFLVFMGLVAVGSVAAIAGGARMKQLDTERPLDELVNREGMILAACVLLVVMTGVVAVGTMWPLIIAWAGYKPVTVSAPFYNKVILPMALLLAAIMATGPILGPGKGAAEKAAKRLAIMGLGGLAAASVAVALLWSSIFNHEGWAVLLAWSAGVALAAGAVVTGVVVGMISSVQARLASGREGTVEAVFNTFAANPRHWGAQLAHLGLAAVVAGVAGSSLFVQSDVFELAAGQSKTVAGYVIAYKELKQERRDTHGAYIADLAITPPNGKTFTLSPERRFYYQGMQEGQSASEVAIQFKLSGDVYANLAGWDDAGKSVTIQLFLNPLVSFIWIGGALMTLAGLVCMVPARRAVVVESETATKTVREVQKSKR